MVYRGVKMVDIYTEIKLIDIEKIKPYENNPRINDETIQKLKEYIKCFGFNVPILIDKHNVIIKGHARYHAAKLLGLKKIPCIVSKKTDEENKLDRIADNRVQEFSKWDEELLRFELRDMPEDLLPLKRLLEYEDYDFKPLNTEIKEINETKIYDMITEKQKSRTEEIVCPFCRKKFNYELPYKL